MNRIIILAGLLILVSSFFIGGVFAAGGNFETITGVGGVRIKDEVFVNKTTLVSQDTIFVSLFPGNDAIADKNHLLIVTCDGSLISGGLGSVSFNQNDIDDNNEKVIELNNIKWTMCDDLTVETVGD